MITWPAKDPDEVLSYGLNWSSALGVDTITASTLTVTSGDVVIDASAFTTTGITATISGGTDGTTSVLTNRVTTAGGFTYEETIELTVSTSAYATEPSTATKRAIVEMAAEEIGLSGNEFDQSPEEYVSALRRLDVLMSRRPFSAIGYNAPPVIGEGALDDASGIPDEHLEVVSIQLALRLMPNIGKTMSAESRLAYTQGLTALRAATAVIPTRLLPLSTAVGAGNRSRTYVIRSERTSSTVTG